MDSFFPCIHDSLDNEFKNINIKIILYFSYHYCYAPTNVIFPENVSKMLKTLCLFQY